MHTSKLKFSVSKSGPTRIPELWLEAAAIHRLSCNITLDFHICIAVTGESDDAPQTCQAFRSRAAEKRKV